MNIRKITILLSACLFTTAAAIYSASAMELNVGPVITLSNAALSAKDSDGDGVKDRKDECPDTPAGVSVDAKGCPVDTDRDGVVDYLDKCPEVPGTDINGCQDKDNHRCRCHSCGIADVLRKHRFE